jgi:hypothetical protein
MLAIASYNAGPNATKRWVNEFYQKEMMIHATNICDDEDIIFVSDIDEIWNPELQIDINSNETYRPIQQSRPVYLNVLADQEVNNWVGTRYGKVKNLRKHGFNHFRIERYNPSIPLMNGGWHFSWLGCSHWDKWGYGDEDGKIRFSRIVHSNKIKEEESLPQYLLNNKEKYKNYFLKTIKLKILSGVNF